MNHDPDTRTLEKFYLDMRLTTDVTATGLEEGVEGAREQVELESHTLALNKLSEKQVSERFGSKLNALFRKLLVVDTTYPTLNAKGRKNRERVLRRVAFHSFRTEAHQAQAEAMTIEEIATRKDGFRRKATRFNKHLLKLARQHVSSSVDDADIRPESTESISFDQDFPEREADDADVPEQDIEDEIAEGCRSATPGQPIVVGKEQMQGNDTVDYSDAMSSINYHEAVGFAMELLLANPLGDAKAPVSTLVTCPMCLDDETLSYDDQQKLRQHLDVNFHSGLQRFSHMVNNQMKRTGADGPTCRFCNDTRPAEEDPTYYWSFPNLSHHIRHSGPTRSVWVTGPKTLDVITRHDQAKRDFGWYDEDFRGIPEGETRRISRSVVKIDIDCR